MNKFLSAMPGEYDGPNLITISGSLEDYYSIGDTKADYYNGMIFMQSSAIVIHEEVLIRTAYYLYDFISEYRLGRLFGPRLMVIFENDMRFMPDLFFVSKGNSGRFTKNEFIGTPDAIVEIITDVTRSYDLSVKKDCYENKKVPEIILADIGEKNFIMNKLENDEYISINMNNKVVPSMAIKGYRWKPDIFLI